MSTGVLSPRQSGEFIAHKSKNVKIIQEGIEKISDQIIKEIKVDPKEVSVNRWTLHELLPQGQNDEAINWVFVSDVLNFSFWSDDHEKCIIKYNGKEWTGYWSLCAVMNRAIDNGYNITDASFMASLSEEDFKTIFKSDSDYEMPMLQERLKIIREEGMVLRDKFGGKFSNVILQAEGSAVKLLQLIIENFPSFRDQVHYAGKKLAIYKRAQILVGDVWACMGGKHPCNFTDVHLITAFADYRVPQALAWMGALQYGEELMQILKNDQLMNYGEEMEVEIRGCTIQAIELVVKRVNEKLQEHDSLKAITVNSIMIDHFLWDLRRNKNDLMTHIPYHKVRCIYY